ncbi:hypothetical protein L873DRAFT_1821765 [Choiromyces venosus 120613-1]|uniref:37S ribosomal protein mrp10, mitochondrial n=1 Tax=Choiromyces venosus 120613-1 TaxID=1336337 RepID=A0A3N4IV39_9PEZI|nr:hypothetical protein L873DRAFT_1821765 [Choiromyces venosus 120613-1]
MRLPPLKKFRIKKPDEPTVNPCIAVMASLLGCWASQGFTPEGCGRIEEQLRSCMDAKVRHILFNLLRQRMGGGGLLMAEHNRNKPHHRGTTSIII